MNTEKCHETQRARWMTTFAFAIVFMIASSPTDAQVRSDHSKPNSSRIIQYRGLLPLLKKEHWGTTVGLRFELYRSPEGGAPFWTEIRTVEIATNGWAGIDLGEVTALPDEAFTTPFRFLSIWHDEVEFYPRKQISSLAYVASPLEKDVLPEDRPSYSQRSVSEANAAAALAPDRDHRLDALVEFPSILLEKHPRPPADWLQATKTAARLGARLPTFEEWYSAYESPGSKALIGMVGHYEWVIPWVYEPSIHSRFHELYKGKPVACYYEELSPINEYPFRLGVTPEQQER